MGKPKTKAKPKTLEENGRVPGSKLTAKHMAGIAALLTSPSVRAAAQSCGVGETTFYAWLRLPAFQEALGKAGGDALRQAMGRLQARAGMAIDTLEAVCSSPDEGGSAKVAAARAILDFGFRALQVNEIEGLVAELRAEQEERDRERGDR